MIFLDSTLEVNIYGYYFMKTLLIFVFFHWKFPESDLEGDIQAKDKMVNTTKTGSSAASIMSVCLNCLIVVFSAYSVLEKAQKRRSLPPEKPDESSVMTAVKAPSEVLSESSIVSTQQPTTSASTTATARPYRSAGGPTGMSTPRTRSSSVNSTDSQTSPQDLAFLPHDQIVSWS